MMLPLSAVIILSLRRDSAFGANLAQLRSKPGGFAFSAAPGRRFGKPREQGSAPKGYAVAGGEKDHSDQQAAHRRGHKSRLQLDHVAGRTASVPDCVQARSAMAV